MKNVLNKVYKLLKDDLLGITDLDGSFEFVEDIDGYEVTVVGKVDEECVEKTNVKTWTDRKGMIEQDYDCEKTGYDVTIDKVWLWKPNLTQKLEKNKFQKLENDLNEYLND